MVIVSHGSLQLACFGRVFEGIRNEAAPKTCRAAFMRGVKATNADLKLVGTLQPRLYLACRNEFALLLGYENPQQ